MHKNDCQSGSKRQNASSSFFFFRFLLGFFFEFLFVFPSWRPTVFFFSWKKIKLLLPGLMTFCGLTCQMFEAPYQVILVERKMGPSLSPWTTLFYFKGQHFPDMHIGTYSKNVSLLLFCLLTCCIWMSIYTYILVHIYNIYIHRTQCVHIYCTALRIINRSYVVIVFFKSNIEATRRRGNKQTQKYEEKRKNYFYFYFPKRSQSARIGAVYFQRGPGAGVQPENVSHQLRNSKLPWHRHAEVSLQENKKDEKIKKKKKKPKEKRLAVGGLRACSLLNRARCAQ